MANEELWGGETRKAVDNFPVSGERVPVPVVRWLGRIKAAAARANADLGLLEQELADRIAAAGDAIAEGQHDDQFPIDVFQTGSGTSSNMNANEVIANIAGEGVHPNDHVNMGQSSNDVFPSPKRPITSCRRSPLSRIRSPPRPPPSLTSSRPGGRT
jgi:fumarate hydratase class II